MVDSLGEPFIVPVPVPVIFFFFFVFFLAMEAQTRASSERQCSELGMACRFFFSLPHRSANNLRVAPNLLGFPIEQNERLSGLRFSPSFLSLSPVGNLFLHNCPTSSFLVPFSTFIFYVLVIPLLHPALLCKPFGTPLLFLKAYSLDHPATTVLNNRKPKKT